MKEFYRKLRRIVLRRSQENRPREEFPGPHPHRQTKRQGRRRHHSPEGDPQHHPQVRQNRRRNPNQRHRNRENFSQRGRRQHFRNRRGNRWRPAADFTGFDDRFEILVELPGVEEKDISVSVVDKMLLVKGKKQRKNSDEKQNFSRSELNYGRFHRAFPLLPMVKHEDIKVDFKDGILTIAIPKKEEAKPKEIPINTET
ncbi:hypothetical protein C6497_10105 [Candidatus Poribacteria bacterium]|nr:MAG: hypothetical protein C6497_10105 [Candidatus Poribacteria bacterium]